MVGEVTHSFATSLTVRSKTFGNVVYLYEPNNGGRLVDYQTPIVILDRRPDQPGFTRSDNVIDAPALVFSLLQADRPPVLFAFVGRKLVRRLPQPD